MSTKEQSLIVRHIGEVYHNANSGKGHSWNILNQALSSCLNNCITCHMPFELDDFKNLIAMYEGGYWFHADNDGKGCGSGFYSQAVSCGNMSACASFEKWRGFDPFIFMGQRLAVYSELNWPKHAPEELALSCRPRNDTGMLNLLCKSGHHWFVTGVAQDRIRVASYYRKGARGKYGHREGKPTKLSSFTHDDLDKMSRAIRKAMSAFKTKKPKKGWVTREMSIEAGNCQQGTDEFIRNRIVPHLENSGCSVGSLDGAAIRATELLKIDDGSYIRRIIRKAHHAMV